MKKQSSMDAGNRARDSESVSATGPHAMSESYPKGVMGHDGTRLTHFHAGTSEPGAKPADTRMGTRSGSRVMGKKTH